MLFYMIQNTINVILLLTLGIKHEIQCEKEVYIYLQVLMY